MKRIAAFVLPAIFSLAIAACSDDDGPDARVSQPSFPDAPVTTFDAPPATVDASTRDAAAADAVAADAT